MRKLIFAIAFVGLAGTARAQFRPPVSGPIGTPGGPPISDPDIPAAPEPLTLGALAIGAGGIVAARLRKKKV
jgi:hypothetical protein